MSESEQRQRDDEILEKFTNQLAEHFENVQIFVSYRDSQLDGTVSASKGAGNWNARYGHVKEWIVTQEQRFREAVRKEFEDEQDDD